MLKNGQTYFKILRCEHCKIFKECSAIFQHYKIKGEICPKKGTFSHFSIDYPVQSCPEKNNFDAKFLVMVFKGKIFLSDARICDNPGALRFKNSSISRVN